MIVIMAEVSGILQIGTLIAIFGWSMEAVNEGRPTVQWKHRIFGCIAGIVPCSRS